LRLSNAMNAKYYELAGSLPLERERERERERVLLPLSYSLVSPDLFTAGWLACCIAWPSNARVPPDAAKFRCADNRFSADARRKPPSRNATTANVHHATKTSGWECRRGGNTTSHCCKATRRLLWRNRIALESLSLFICRTRGCFFSVRIT